MSNQKGSILVFLGVVVSIILLISGVYYLKISQNKPQQNIAQAPSKSPQFSPLPSPTSAPNTGVMQQIKSELKGIPIYTDAVFTKREVAPPCVEGNFTGYSICNSTAFYLKSKDDFDQISVWYKEDRSGSGWTCSGGAGSYNDPRSASGVTSCRKGGLGYRLHLFAKATETEIIIEISSKNNVQSPNTPEAVAQNFYNWYLNCLEYHFANSIGQNSNTTCPYQKSAYITPELLQNIKIRHGMDPILCSQNTPKSISVSKGLVTSDLATVKVYQQYNSQVTNEANLRLNDRLWKITNISCN